MTFSLMQIIQMVFGRDSSLAEPNLNSLCVSIPSEHANLRKLSNLRTNPAMS